MVGIDAPLIVTNPTGKRPCEAALNRDFAKFEAGAHPTNTGKPEFANGTRGGTPGRRAGPGPRPALASAAARARGLSARGDGGVVPARPDAEVQGQEGPQLRAAAVGTAPADGPSIEGLQDADVPLRVTEHDDWQRACDARSKPPTRKSELRRAEDPVDAVLCAYVGAVRRPPARRRHRLRRRRDRLHPHTDAAARADSCNPPEPTPAAVRDAIADYADRRPALVAATDELPASW